MAGWIKTDFWFSDRTVFLLVGERDAREIGDLLREQQENPDVLQKKLSGIIDRCRPDLVGHVLWFVNFSPLKRAWELLVHHPSLPTKKMFEESPSQLLRLEDAVEASSWFNAERNLNLADMKTVKLADEPITVS